jgi:sodium transport system ATP-binding protein
MQEAEYLCHRIGLLHRGKILDIDTFTGFKEKTNLANLSEIFLHYIASQKEDGYEA